MGRFQIASLRRTRFAWIAVAAIAVLLAWSANVRSRSVHVSDILGQRDAEGYTISCRVTNPLSRQTRIALIFSVLARVRSGEHAGWEILRETRPI